MSLTVAQDEMQVAWRLFLPETWTTDRPRCARAGVPETGIAPWSKSEIALHELDQSQAADA